VQGECYGCKGLNLAALDGKTSWIVGMDSNAKVWNEFCLILTLTIRADESHCAVSRAAWPEALQAWLDNAAIIEYACAIFVHE
jgi:hypothetical protein